MHFNQLGLHPALLAAVEASGYTEPTAVQAQSIPAALAGADLLVSSFTGSGKTAAFILPSLQRLSKEPAVKGNGPRILVLTPTRELAMQIEQAATTYGSRLDRRLRVACLVGGMPYPLQLRKLQGPLDLVIATPGRLIDHLDRGRVDFKRLEVLVLDEADRMLDMGFIEDIEKIIARTPPARQTMLFSATLDGVVGNMAKRITRDPKRIQIAPTAQRKAHIEQSALFADSMHHKTKLLDALLRDVEMKQALVFTSTKRAADDLSGALREQGFSAQALHGDMNQTQRNRTLKGLVDGRTRVLVATDVAARGIDVAGISHVINFDAPRQAEDYVHRIGRTGRAGRTGIAVTFVNHDERHLLRDIERFTGQQVKVDTIEGLEPTRRAESRKAAPRFQKRPGSYDKARPGARSARTGRAGAQARPWLAR